MSAPMTKPGDVTVVINDAALMIAGLDDQGRFTDLERVSRGPVRTAVTGQLAALVDLATELNDRATEDDAGYGHSDAEKAVLRRAVASLSKQGIKAKR